MLRRALPVVTVAACFVVALAASVFAAQAPAPTPAPDQALALAPAPDQTPDQVQDPGQCLPDSVGLPAPLFLKGNQTCDECLAYCEQRELDCMNHCLGLDCGVKCPNQYFQCVAGCPC